MDGLALPKRKVLSASSATARKLMQMREKSQSHMVRRTDPQGSPVCVNVVDANVGKS